MDDLISRQDAINAINKAFERVFAWDGTSPLGDKVLENVPSAQPEQRWIPCSERLPEEGEIVLTQANIENMISLCVASRQDYNYWKGWNTREINVVAWMPLPEPYREERTEE